MKPFTFFLFLSIGSFFVACSTTPEQKETKDKDTELTSSTKLNQIKAPKDELDALNPNSKTELKARLKTEPAIPANTTTNKAKKGEALRVSDIKVEPKSTKPIEVQEKKNPPKAENPVLEGPVVTEESIEKENKETKKHETTVTPKTEVVSPPKPVITTVDHSPWNQLLQKHVSANGKVNYKGFKSDLSPFTAYLSVLSENPIKNEWSRQEKMAYWINVYNGYTIKLIVDNYPVKSITDLEGGKPWDKKWIKIGNKTYSLNNIENDILRPQFKEPGIHFAVNCAAKSCPPLLNRAWTAKNLNANFKKQATAFINNPQYNEVSAGSLKLSKIFDWYKGDFGDLIAYLNKFSKTSINKDAAIGFKEYDWNLNN